MNELKLYASLAASAYCMPWNMYPRVRCGYPRCTNDQLTIRSMSPHSTDDNEWRDADVLKATRTLTHFVGRDTAMTGLVAVNEVLDHFESADGPFRHNMRHVTRKKVIVVAFRGSLVLKNFLYDLYLAMTDFTFNGAPANAKVHYGFWRVWKDVQ